MNSDDRTLERRAEPMRLFRTAVVLLGLGSAACFVPVPWQVAVPLAVASTAIVTTAVVVSANRPPPPRVVYVVPADHPGYAWQPGYWTLQGDHWVWVDGRWIATPPGYDWSPTRWEQAPDGTWRLVPGTLVPVAPR